MKKVTIALLILAIQPFLAIVPPVSAGSVCDPVDLEWIQEHVSFSPGAGILQKQEKGGLCEVVLFVDGDLVPVYAGKDFILIGDLFRKDRFVTRETLEGLSDVAREERKKAREKEALAREKRKLFFKNHVKDLEGVSLLSFKPDKAESFLYVIVDPGCSYSRELLPGLEQAALESELELRIIVYPVLGRESLDMARAVICEQYTYEVFKEAKAPETPATCQEADLLIEKTTRMFEAEDISFVPLVIAGNGSWVVEGNGIDEVRENLDLAFSVNGGEERGACDAH